MDDNNYDMSDPDLFCRQYPTVRGSKIFYRCYYLFLQENTILYQLILNILTIYHKYFMYHSQHDLKKVFVSGTAQEKCNLHVHKYPGYRL